MVPATKAVDWLSITGSTESASQLLPLMGLIDEGTRQQGFRQSEKRECLGGYCWRKFEPYSESKLWGLDYEAWEFSGHVARHAHRYVPDGFRASRVDVAFDFECPADFLADHLAAGIAPHTERVRISTGISGQDGICTHYVGAATSTRRVRIYRRDLRDPSRLYSVPPTLRVELTLKGDHAAGLYQLLREDEPRAFGAACTHLEAMIGLELGQLAELPEPPAEPDFDSAQRLFAFMRQNASYLDAITRMGVDVLDLAREFLQASSVRTQHRHGVRLVEFGSIDWEQTVDLARTRMRRENAPA